MVWPAFCSRKYPNELYETYKGYEIWRCYHARFDPQIGIVYDPVFYEKNHPEESADYRIENVRAWIDGHLPPPPPPPEEEVPPSPPEEEAPPPPPEEEKPSILPLIALGIIVALLISKR